MPILLKSGDANPLPSPAHIVHGLIALLPSFFWATVILVLTFVISRLASGRLSSGLQRGGLRTNVAILLARTLWVGLWAIGVLLILAVFNVGLSPLAAFIGVVGLAASLALQQVLQNVVAGIYLLAEHPFQIGDVIAVVGPAGANHEGRVENIHIRTTHLRNRDNELILMPNSSIFSGVVTNRTAVGGFARHVTLTFPRATDPTAVHDGVRDAVASLPGVLQQPGPRLWVDKVTSEDWTASLTVWCSSHGATSEIVWALADAYPEATVDSGAAS